MKGLKSPSKEEKSLEITNLYFKLLTDLIKDDLNLGHLRSEAREKQKEEEELREEASKKTNWRRNGEYRDKAEEPARKKGGTTKSSKVKLEGRWRVVGEDLTAVVYPEGKIKYLRPDGEHLPTLDDQLDDENHVIQLSKGLTF